MPKSANQTESLALAWLQRRYAEEDITFHPRSSPDFTTADGKGWEVKLARQNAVVFTQRQADGLDADCAVLIWADWESPEPATILRFGDIPLPGRLGRYTFTVTPEADKTLSVRLPQEASAALQDLAAREHRSINAQLVHLITEATKTHQEMSR